MEPLDLSAPPEAIRLMQFLGLVPDPWQVQVLESTVRSHPAELLPPGGQDDRGGRSRPERGPLSAREPGPADVRQRAAGPGGAAHHRRRLPPPKQPHGASLHPGPAGAVATAAASSACPARKRPSAATPSVSLLIIDEAARVPDDLYRAVRPMLAVSDGRLICLSTPYGKRGFFYEAWANGGDDWPRDRGARRAACRASPPTSWSRNGGSWASRGSARNICCSFEALEGLVYPDFAGCVVPGPAPQGGQRVGGIDFGFRNPFAAVWGTAGPRRRPLADRRALHARQAPELPRRAACRAT